LLEVSFFEEIILFGVFVILIPQKDILSGEDIILMLKLLDIGLVFLMIEEDLA
jgi:hypothetical protein